MSDIQDISTRRANLTAEQRAKLAQRLRGAGSADRAERSSIPRRPAGERIALSFAQQRQWFLWKLDPAGTAYHLSGGLVLDGHLDAQALRASVQALVDRHESLRTVFREADDGEVEQVVQDTADIALPCIDLSALAGPAREAAIRQEVQRIRTDPFDLTRGPLMRAVLLRAGAQSHRLLVVMHHIVSDGWSVQLILDELAVQYAARVQGQVPVHAGLPIQYADYARWQSRWLAEGEGERQLDWWRGHLGAEQPVISLHTDYPRKADGRYRAAHHTFALPADTIERLRQQAQGQGATLFMALLAGFNALLFRHTAQTDVRVGVPIANRNRAETAGVVGFFVNTQVLRSRIDACMTLAELLVQTRDAAIGAQTHQDLPFEQLVGALQPERSLSANPLFQVMFNHLRRDHRSLAEWPGVAVQRLDFEEEGAQFELTLQTLELEDGRVDATILYASELFDVQTIERMAGHYLAVLQALANEPQRAVSDVALLDKTERTQLASWSENTRRHEGAQPVHRQIEQHARQTPDATALLFGDEALSYGELNARANRLAHRLIALGVKPEALVGIVVDRSVEMMVGILAILKAGGAYVPLDPEYPADRLAYMVEDSGIALLLTQRHLRPLLPAGEALRVLELDTLDVSTESATDPKVALHGEHLAYVIYTSGSTGKPKGAAIRHDALYSCMAWMQETYRLTEADTVLHKAPFGFDVSCWEMFWPLTTGVRLVIANPGDHRDPERLVQLIQRHQITTLNFVPSMLQAFLAHEGIEATTRLRYIICGGEAMPAATQREALQRLKGASLQNLYGPTETTIHVTQWTCRDDGLNQVPIGRPISDTQAYVLDAQLNEVPAGVAGELYLGGINLARGYLRRAGLTSERFVATNNGQRLYRTGDLVRWNAEGQIEYLGRIDHQVKVRGFRIELGEIEAQLLAQPEVREAVVVADEGPSGARLVGYVSAHAGQAIDVTVLRGRLGRALPDYMVPGVVMVLERLPLNANGKVDRKALPRAEFTSERAYEAPEGVVEQALAAIWAEVLGVARVGRGDNFFELGGDSILSLKVVARAHRQGIRMSPRQVFEHQGLALIADAIHGDDAADVPAIPALSTSQRAGGLALSHAQTRQWFLWQLDPQSTAYHVSGALRLAGALDADAVRASLNELVQRHESLRTVFRADASGMAEQVVRETGGIDFSLIDLGNVAEDGMREARARQEARRLSDTPFDLGQGPLLRVGLIRLAAEVHVLVVVMHHIVSDGWSMQIIVDEFVARYRARVLGHAPDLQPLSLQYADYAAWQRAWLEAGEKDRQLAYWKAHVGTEQPVLQLPTDHARRADGRYSAVRHGFALPDSLVKALHRRAQGQGATLFMALLAGFQVLLSRYTGQEDIRLGVPVANRHRAEIEGVIGFFVNTQVLRGVMDGRSTLSQVLVQARDTALGAQAHQDLPFEQLVEVLQPERSLSTSPLFQVMFNHQRGDFRALQSLPGLTLTDYELEAQAAQFELALDTSEDMDGRVQASFRYASELFDARTMERMAGHYLAVLQALADAPQQAVGDVVLLGEAERAQLASWGERKQDFESAQTVHGLIEHQAKAQPQATALVYEDRALSYGELNARANRLAHHLIALGVKPEAKVGIAVERSIAMVVGILAILKAGGAYVPLDPAYPAERLAYMVADSGVALVLTQSHLSVPGTQALQVLALDALDTGHESDADPQVALSGENLAYVIYTSGSTGRPKGAQLCHRNVTRLLDATEPWFHFGPEDVWTMFHSYAFDFSVWEMFGALCTGGKLVVVPFWVSRSPEDFLGLLRAQQVTVLNQTPSAFGQLIHTPGLADTEDLALRHVIFGGEALEPNSLRTWMERFGDDKPQLINMYGITETTVHVTYRRITVADLGQQRSPVGLAIPDLGLCVLDAQLNRVPIGVAGELHVSGEGLARGYLNRAGLTAERFVATDHGQRLYRTGDLVRWSGEGQLEYLGRIDHQVKVRGFRIELGEIEAQLLAQPELREAIVLAREGPGGTRLVGYVSVHGGQSIETGALRERLAQTLPDYMVPSALVVLQGLPLNANGKVDRKALPDAQVASEQVYEAPEGAVEEALAAIWAEVLGVARVGRGDNFFELGGDSILSLKVAARARRSDVHVTARQIFEHQVLARIASAIEVEVVREARKIPVLTTAQRAGAMALSHAQMRQWFLWQLDPKSTAYHISGALRLVGALDVDAVRASFGALVARHESLRTVFRADAQGLAEQVIREVGGPEMALIDLGAVSADYERETRAKDAATRLSDVPFDLSEGPLLRMGLVRLAAEEHVLVVVMHHIVSDGWSMQIVVDEFVALYRARMQGAAPGLQPLPLQYVDYAAWQRQWLEAGEAERQLVYWKQQIGTEHPVLQLPVDHARRADGRYRAARHGFELPVELVKGLQKRAQGQGATLFMALLAGFQVLLHRYTAEQDIRVGVPIANRHRAETEGVIGFFINTQVLRGVVNDRVNLLQMLTQARDAATGAQDHQDLPFEQLVEALQPERSLSTSPLFQVMFNHQRADFRSLQSLPDLALTEYELGEQAAQFELTLDTSEGPNGRVQARFNYASELFDARTMERMAGHYLAVLQALADAPQQAVGDVVLLGEAERAQLASWGERKQDFESAQTVHGLIEHQAKAQPQATALVYEDRALSYGELNARANRLAHHLIALGVKPEAKVGIAVERSIAMVVGILAILKAGGAYVPLDPAYPAERLAYMVADSGVALVLTQSHLSVPGTQALQVLALDALDTGHESDADPQVALSGENLAYVIYTSGSTGRPKGAQLCHRNVTRLLDATEPWFHFGPEDVWTMFHSYAFDFSVWEMFGALCTGGKLVVVPFWVSRSPEDFLGLLRAQQVTVLNQTPSAFGQLIHTPGLADTEDLALRHVIFGGEALEPNSLRTWMERFGDDKPQLINMYGITETTVHVTYRRITVADLGQQRSPVGLAIPDLGLCVLDAQLNRVPIGVAGELHVSGEGLARGYLNRAGLTAERFVATDHGQRLYRTGDLVRWSGEGQLEYLGRIDHQVKVRGFRIELGEIEAQLLAQPELREAIVLAREGPGGTRLVGYVSVHGGQSIETGALRERLAQTLPDYMVPSALVVLQGLPLNANGKVDRKALPDAQVASEQVYEAPEGAVEEALAAIWAEVLGVARVGRGDNFFELGGHSLLALRLLERVRGQGWPVQVRTLFQHPQLGAFAQALLQAQAQGHREVVVPPNLIPEGCEAIQPAMLTLVELDAAQIARIEADVPGGAANIQDIYPLAPLQEGMLFHHLLQSAGDAYVTPQLLSFDSRERLEQFIDSFDQVIARHDILRTAVLWEGLAAAVQVVHRQAKLPLQWLQAGSDSEAGSNEAGSVEERLNAHVNPAHYRIDVRQAPMVRAIAAHDPVGQRWLLQLPNHHMVLDHTTLELLVEEIALIQQGRQHELPEPVPFRRYVAQARLGVSQAEHEAFFSEMLGDVDEPTAPFNLLDVQGDGTRIEEVRLPLEAELAVQIRGQAQRHGVSAATLFHLAWALVLGKATGKDDVVFGTVLFGRMQGGEGAERALGLFINTLPLRVRLGARGVQASLRETHAALTQLLHHEHASLALAQRCSGLPGGTPLFSAMLNYRYTPKADAGDGDGDGEEQERKTSAWEGMEVLGGEERTNYPVTLSVDDEGEGFALVAQIHEAVDAQRVCGFMHAALSGIVQALQDQPQRPVCELALMPAGETDELAAWGVNPRRYEDVQPVHRLIEQQARRTPDAPALSFGEQTLGYGELNARANRLAHHLIALGVKPEAKVGIAVERSLEMVVGILAILKAGGAYVPLDPEYPVERLAYMVADSGVSLLLTQSRIKDQIPADPSLVVLAVDTLDTNNQSDTDPQVAIDGENLAYVIYTSGSTGKPKGVMVRHLSLSHFMLSMKDAPGLTSDDVLVAVTSLSFDIAALELYLPLLSGAHLVLASRDVVRSGSALGELMDACGATVLQSTPAGWRLLRAGGWNGSRLAKFKGLCGGEALQADLAQDLQALGVELWNMYGPTETTIWSTAAEVRGGPRIGGPIAATQLHVLDGSLNPTPAGVPGELFLGGIGLARGYFERAGLTSERFVATDHGQRLYRTGDLVRWNVEGQLEYLGRIDHQVKVRGFRIELGEIEAQLLAQPEVREAVVVARESASGSRLAAYIALHAQAHVDTAVLRDRLAVTLPDYMVPAAIVVLDRLPLNGNGKVDRKALPEAEFTSDRAYEAPEGEVEEALAAIWSELLGIARIGRSDNFFELGGHSLLAVQVASRVQAAMHADLRIQDIFPNPTLLGMAALIAAAGRKKPTDESLLDIDAFIDSMETA
ncbi:non-ribosomal peptide synthase/polyketide synthase [Variovorax paradoxus]|uniref:Amino acid adenylation domain protein n=1 Tax=Variovorax paradoxus (strain EPS) TaxID=595537 RepID=E6V979_VARPE|nr:non-ribosomal peptide synthetase [Variovorax paradoxus]ADU38494.1 amino acid adenylation domain protein [Variovorax paradoxus EPS]